MYLLYTIYPSSIRKWFAQNIGHSIIPWRCVNLQLFEMGLELSLARLKALAKFAFGMGLTQVSYLTSSQYSCTWVGFKTHGKEIIFTCVGNYLLMLLAQDVKLIGSVPTTWNVGFSSFDFGYTCQTYLVLQILPSWVGYLAYRPI